MEHVPSKDRFWDVAPAADRIFGHVRSHPQLSRMTLDFDYGLVDGPSSRAIARFSCSSRGNRCQAVVWVSALTRLDGTWEVTHSLQWSE